MTTRNKLDQLLSELSEERLKQLLDFAEFLSAKEENEDWSSFIFKYAEAFYDGDESDYTLDDDIFASP